MSIKRLKDFPSASTGGLSDDDIFLMMDDPSGSGITQKVSLSTLSSVLTNTSLVAGSGIALTYNNNNNSLSINATGTAVGGSGSTTVVDLSYSSTINTNASTGDIFDVTLTGNTTLANPTNPVNGKTLRWRITQDGTGNWAVTLGNKFNIPSTATSPLPFSTAANKMDVLAATYHSGRDKWDVVAFVPGY
jgi:hypothetical protein